MSEMATVSAGRVQQAGQMAKQEALAMAGQTRQAASKVVGTAAEQVKSSPTGPAGGRAGQAGCGGVRAAAEGGRPQAGRQAAGEVKDTAAEAARATKEQAEEQAGQVTDQARQSIQTPAEEARGQTRSPGP
ncbi:hypothetical protein WJ438_08070 [Streptomyces sp. GD-15H]|uniref:hypothetical protein n=1 Tax=Streptomyces sp. GD-15H TaxID=3129112 RepID=UPI00324EE9F7